MLNIINPNERTRALNAAVPTVPFPDQSRNLSQDAPFQQTDLDASCRSQLKNISDSVKDHIEALWAADIEKVPLDMRGGIPRRPSDRYISMHYEAAQKKINEMKGILEPPQRALFAKKLKIGSLVLSDTDEEPIRAEVNDTQMNRLNVHETLSAGCIFKF